MIIYTNSFALHTNWRDYNGLDDDVIDFALKMLRPVVINGDNGGAAFNARKIVLLEEDMHKVTEFLYSISATAEFKFTYVQHPDEIYFLVTVYPLDYALIEQTQF